MTAQTTAYERLLDALRDAGSTVIRNGRSAKAQCPAHDDSNPSLSISYRRDGKGAVLYCHTGCDIAAVLAAVGLSIRDLFDDDAIRDVYSPWRDYRYPDGRVVHRKPDKTFPQSGNRKGKSLFHADSIGDADTVYVPEGEKDVEAIEAIGGTAVCSAMGAGKAHLADWSPLAGRRAIIIADKDEPNSAGKRPGREHAIKEAELLDDIAASVEITEAAVGKDASDHIAAGKMLDQLMPADWWPTAETDPDAADDKKARKRSAASLIVDMARCEYELGISDDGTPYGSKRDMPHVAMSLRGGKLGLRAELARRYFDEQNAAAPSQRPLTDALAVLDGYAAQRQPKRLNLRVAGSGGAVYIDLADKHNRVIAIRDGQWMFTDNVPVMFRRTELTAPMPDPDRPGDLTKLWKFINVVEADRPILLAFMVAALVQPDVSHVILGLLAEHGSAKSTTTKRIVSLIDPSHAPLWTPPRDIDAWVIAANGSWTVALDNLTHIPDWLSDALCRAATGDALPRRRLYTDAELSVIQFRRCSIVNGIELGGLNGDLTDRLALVDLERITEDLTSDTATVRRAETELETGWLQEYPSIFGGLLSLAARVHHRLPNITVSGLPRMADFAKTLACVDEITETNGLKRYRDRRTHLAADSVAADSFIARLQEMNIAFVNATAAEILTAVSPQQPGWRPPQDWPKKSRLVTTRLTRHAPALRAIGWKVENDDGKNVAHATRWTITPKSADEPDTSQADAFNSSENMSSTCGDEPTSQTSHKCGQSLVGITALPLDDWEDLARLDSTPSAANQDRSCKRVSAGSSGSSSQFNSRELDEPSNSSLLITAEVDGPWDDQAEPAQQRLPTPQPEDYETTCTVCTKPMWAPVSIERGVCESCGLAAKKLADRNGKADTA